MRKLSNLFILTTALTLAICGCEPTSTPSITPAVSSATSVPSAISTTLPTSTPQGKTIIVTSADDSGPGTLRQSLLDANIGDTINFDTSVFPPDQPKVIFLQSMLPLAKGNLTIDASHDGVILDGSKFPDGWESAIQVSSNNNTISGFQVRNFSGAAIYISSGQNNLIMDNVIGGSDYGIFLGGGTSNNKISGNYVGFLDDRVTPLGNRVSGISVGEGAHDNQIGPDNVIAYNGQVGIYIGGSNAIGNTIIQNSIHDNGWFGIRLSESNNNLSAPILMGFDFEAGTLVGIACVQCTVEIFSDSGYEGAIYEGQTVADENGEFAFDNNNAFAKPYLTATATDVNGNSSEFSQHTIGLRGSFILQEGNNLPKTKIVTTPYQELVDNRIENHNSVSRVVEGSCSPLRENYRIKELFELGTKWMHFGLDDEELYIPRVDGWYSKFEFTECQDNTISFFVENGTTMVSVLNYWDEYDHAEKWPDYGDEEEVQRFLEYTRFQVSHFKGRIQYYEILNEPNLYYEVDDYINLIRQAIPVIREADPEAKIVVGAVTGLEGTDSRDYLFEILRSDIMPLVDVVSWHPMYGTSPQYDETREYYYYYPSLVQEIKDTATAHGFDGDYMASEMVWGTPDHPTPQPWAFTYTIAAKYSTRAIVMNLGMNVVAGITGASSEASYPFNVRTVRNLSEVMAGAIAIELPIEILSEDTNIKSYSFSLLNDEILIALWVDGVAVDHDPGIPSTLILPGLADLIATGIDVLYGFEQELVSSNENGDLVIRDFLLKDYPIFIRLSQ